MKKKGFTLVEILVVALILGILSAVAIPTMTGYVTQTSDQVCEHTASMVLGSIIAFINDQDPTLLKLTPGQHRDIDELNAILGKFHIKIPDEFTIDVLVTDNEHVTVFIQNDEYAGSATLGS